MNCKTCNGSGKIYISAKGKYVKCYVCNGSGSKDKRHITTYTKRITDEST